MKYLIPLLLNLFLLLLYFFGDITANVSMVIIVVNIFAVPVYLLSLYYKSLPQYSTVKKVQMLFAMIGIVLGCGAIQFLYWGITAETLFSPDSTTVEIIWQTAKWGIILTTAGGCVMNALYGVKKYLKDKNNMY